MDETYEQSVIRLLSLLTNATENVTSDETWLLTDIRLMTELEASGYIRAGDIVRGGMGDVMAICGMSITTKGRQYLSELQREAAGKTSVGLIKQNKFGIYKWIFGIAAVVIGAYLVKHFGFK